MIQGVNLLLKNKTKQNKSNKQDISFIVMLGQIITLTSSNTQKKKKLINKNVKKDKKKIETKKTSPCKFDETQEDKQDPQTDPKP